MNINKIMLITLVLCTFFLGACSVINTSPISSTEKGYIENKIPYFLPTGRLRIKMFVPEGSPESECKMEVEEVYVAERLLFLEYNPSIWSSDSEITIGVDGKGFLNSIYSKTKDATPEIIAGLAKIAKMAMGIPPTPENFVGKPCKLDITFDPFNDAEKISVLTKVRDINTNITDFQIDPMFKKIGNAWKQKATDIQNIKTGVVYLTQLPYKFKVVTSNNLVQPTQMVYLPNESPAFVLDVKRKPFVENQINITFEQGSLTQVKWTKPSEALGFINIPIEVGKAIMSIPGELLSVKVNDLNAEKGLLEAQKNHIEAQLQLIKKKAEFEEQNN